MLRNMFENPHSSYCVHAVSQICGKVCFWSSWYEGTNVDRLSICCWIVRVGIYVRRVENCSWEQSLSGMNFLASYLFIFSNRYISEPLLPWQIEAIGHTLNRHHPIPHTETRDSLINCSDHNIVWLPLGTLKQCALSTTWHSHGNAEVIVSPPIRDTPHPLLSLSLSLFASLYGSSGMDRYAQLTVGRYIMVAIPRDVVCFLRIQGERNAYIPSKS